ncbi:YlmH/Sll1252 family protein [uncultured Eubacterium sp.]|uniref:YlmH/Sll1252 family protein n=1 Tax=uncultured Eubacterium sp. TaxID=165185 RepID=UPI0025DAC3B5|nr:YlmH/Sll1252 family protein [uncultured Eubacterium sp.]
MKENEELKRRVLDLANRCYQQNIYTFSGFLNAAEVSDVYAMERELDFVPWKLFGGTEGCERQILRFGSEETLGYEEEFPISCVVIRPSAPKFAEELSHRDFLGALMNLGIERDVLGDIIVREATGYVFCEDAMAVYLAEHITQVRHTSMITEITKECPRQAAPEFVEEEFVVSSNRCDAVVAKAYKLSRTQSTELFRAGKIFVNGRQYNRNSGILRNGDIVSVRGFGKFVFQGFLQETKKGRIRVGIARYV